MYHNIPISDKNLQQLPEDDIPDVLWKTSVMAGNDEEVANDEQDGYVE